MIGAAARRSRHPLARKYTFPGVADIHPPDLGLGMRGEERAHGGDLALETRVGLRRGLARVDAVDPERDLPALLRSRSGGSRTRRRAARRGAPHPSRAAPGRARRARSAVRSSASGMTSPTVSRPVVDRWSSMCGRPSTSAIELASTPTRERRACRRRRRGTRQVGVSHTNATSRSTTVASSRPPIAAVTDALVDRRQALDLLTQRVGVDGQQARPALGLERVAQIVAGGVPLTGPADLGRRAATVRSAAPRAPPRRRPRRRRRSGDGSRAVAPPTRRRNGMPGPPSLASGAARRRARRVRLASARRSRLRRAWLGLQLHRSRSIASSISRAISSSKREAGQLGLLRVHARGA